MQITQCLERAVQTRGKYVGTIYRERKRTWATLGDRVKRAAGGLKAMGVRPGDRVAVLAMNSDNYLELFFAIAWCGGVSVPLNTRWAVPENVYALKDAEPVALIVDEHFAAQLPALTAQYPVANLVYIGDGGTPPNCIGYESMIERSSAIDNECGIDNDLCGIFYTGGTTGNPKGVMLSHKNMVFASVTWIATLHFSENTTYLHSAGFFHLAGTSPALALTMAGGTHVCLPKFDAVAAFEAIQSHRVNYCLFVPTMVNLLINHPRFDDYDLKSVRYCEYGASPMPDAVLALAMEKLPTWEFIQGYGMTECAALTVSMPWRYHFDSPDWKSKRLGTGYAAYGSDIRIVDEQAREVPRGETGEIAIRGPQVMLGYWRQPEATAAVLKNGWMISGDAAWMDDDGFVYIVDRVKDMIISGGENIFSREVENAVHQHAAVRECAVIGIPNEQWGEAVHAVVVLREGMSATAEQIIEHCRGLIAGYKCPRSVEVRTELPTSAAGKIMKNLLRQPHWADRAKAVH